MRLSIDPFNWGFKKYVVGDQSFTPQHTESHKIKPHNFSTSMSTIEN